MHHKQRPLIKHYHRFTVSPCISDVLWLQRLLNILLNDSFCGTTMKASCFYRRIHISEEHLTFFFFTAPTHKNYQYENIHLLCKHHKEEIERKGLIQDGYIRTIRPGTHSVDQDGLELRDLSAPASWVLESKVSTTTHSCRTIAIFPTVICLPGWLGMSSWGCSEPWISLGIYHAYL